MMDLDFDKYCLVDGSPTTVLPPPRHRSSVANRKLSGNDTPNLTEEFEIDFSDYLSGSCRDVWSQRIGSEVVKRGSVYQSSKEVSLIQKTDAVLGRKKIEFSPRTASARSIEIIDSLCNSDEESSVFEHSRASVMSSSGQSTSSAYENGVDFCYDASTVTLESVNMVSLQKSSLAKLALLSSPAKSERDSPKARFSPVKKMFDPFVKSMSRMSPLSNSNEAHGETISGKTVCRSLLGDMSEMPHPMERNHQYEEKENYNSCSPAHLHGLLKLGNKHGVPIFQFSVNSPEDVYMAKTWKVENGSTWVYTLHSLPNRRKRNSSGWGFKECNRESSMVGRMHVSCHLPTEFTGAEQLKDSMVTEFVLYDILHSRKSTASQDNTSFFDDTGPFASSAAAKLHPGLESAAIVMQVPLEKRESLKFKRGVQKIDETPKEGDTSSHGKMHVVIPAGNHSLPGAGSYGPSPLLDRWRSGGGCDCGGWDMACPLTIFTQKIAEATPLTDNQHRAELFVQGRKDNTPAFTMMVVEVGRYAVDFHAQLSSLQAFSICIAILHAAEASPVGQERSKPISQGDPLRVYTEEEIKTMLDTVAEGEKSKLKRMEQVVPPFVLNPPFSPIARV